MKNEETVIIPTDYETTGTYGAEGMTAESESLETRGVAVKKKYSMKDIFFGDIDWKYCGEALTKDVSFEGFKRVMTSDVDFGAIKTALLYPVPDKNIDLGGAIKRLFSIQVKF